MAVLDVRVAAVNVMLDMQSGGGSLTRLLPIAQQQVADADKALLQALCFGMARWSGRLRGLVDGLLSKPLKRKDTDIYILMQLCVFQLAYSRVAPHAAVDTTVAAVKHFKKPWAKGLVNAVLRNFQRRGDSLVELLDEPASLSHPQWLLSRFKKDWPDNWQKIIEYGNQQAPMTLRVNRRQVSTGDYLQQLNDCGIEAKKIDGLTSALVLENPVPVQSLPQFDHGFVSVQDGAAQIAAQLLGKGVLGNGKGMRLLDACCAPGGKTAHALEYGKWGQVVALDQDADRLFRVKDTLQRLKIEDRYELHCVDAAETNTWWDGNAFDAILLDAPCSGTGVIRRHPDIKLLRRESDIGQLVSIQRKLLTSLWDTLAPGGQLLYATCSVMKDENEAQINWFLEHKDDAREIAIDLPFGVLRSVGRIQILPGEHDMDGFYYALLAKT